MSWQLWETEMGALTGKQHISREQYSQVIATAYHNCILRHFDAMTGGGKVFGLEAKLQPLYEGVLQICNANLGGHSPVNFVQQLQLLIMQYWTGVWISGPTGIVALTSPGSFTSPYVGPNLDFRIILKVYGGCFRAHLATLTGVYTSTVVPGLVTPWSGGFLQTIG